MARTKNRFETHKGEKTALPSKEWQYQKFMELILVTVNLNTTTETSITMTNLTINGNQECGHG